MEKTRYSGLQTLVLAGSLITGMGLGGCAFTPIDPHDPFGILAREQKQSDYMTEERRHRERIEAMSGRGNTASQPQVPKGVTLYLTDRDDDKAGITRKTKFKRGEKIYSKAIINVGYVEKIENYIENIETGENLSGGMINKPFNPPNNRIIYMSGALDATHMSTLGRIFRVNWEINGKPTGNHIFEVEN